MNKNQNITFIDSKGVSHNARVESFREDRDPKTNELLDEEPLVTLNYNDPKDGHPVTLIDVHHIGHPRKQDSNADLPQYALHAWKLEDEEHLEVPPDHPLHDHPYEVAKFDDQGKVIPKRRPVYERHIRWHQEAKRGNQNARSVGTSEVTPLNHKNSVPGVLNRLDETEVTVQPAAITPTVELGHPAHPETVRFPFICDSCGADVHRTASHHGGKQWEKEILANSQLNPPGTGVSSAWKEHICDPARAAAFAESKKTPKHETPMDELQKLALEPAGDPPKAEPDVSAMLDQAGPPPSEPEKPAGEQA